MECNQYQHTFYDLIIKETIHNILTDGKKTNKELISSTEISDTIAKRPLFIKYRGNVTEQFVKNLHKCKAPCTFIMTMRKLKSALPLLKPEIEKALKSGVVYHIKCAGCEAAYVGQTQHHLSTRVKEHLKLKSPVAEHSITFSSEIKMEQVRILERGTIQDQLKI